MSRAGCASVQIQVIRTSSPVFPSPAPDLRTSLGWPRRPRPVSPGLPGGNSSSWGLSQISYDQEDLNLFLRSLPWCWSLIALKCSQSREGTADGKSQPTPPQPRAASPFLRGGPREQPQDLRVDWHPLGSLLQFQFQNVILAEAIFQVLDGADASANKKEDTLGKSCP